MEKKQTTDRYTLADLENWSAVAGDLDPPIRLGVFGNPVAHSLSPQMQNAGLRACDIDMQYARFHIRPNELRPALLLLRRLDFVGINLTVPHKIAAFTQIDEADESATRAGAVNTIRVRDGKLIDSNTALLRAADEAGARGANGLFMLLHQGALSFSIWFNRESPIEAMRAALL